MKTKSKILTRWPLYIILFLLIMGCEKNEIKQPEACMEIFNSTTGNKIEIPYQAMINQSINISSCYDAQLYAFYSGTEGKKWQGEVTPENEGLSSPNGSFSISYPAPGEYKMTLILTNRGEDYMEFKKDEVSSTITISDNNTELISFDIKLSTGTILKGVPQGNQFIFIISEGISLSNVTPQFETGTDFSTVTLNGEEIESGASVIDLNQSANLIVTAFDGTQNEYEITINTF